MSKSKLFLAAAVSLAFQSAHAYDTLKIGDVEITPYARVVAGIDYTSNIMSSGMQGTRVQVASNQWGTSYWGMTLKTPLTDGWSGVAHLESGFGSNNGQSNNNGTLFNRRSNVGLYNEKFGELTVGNHMWIANDAYDVDPMGHQWIGLNTLVGGRNWGIGPNTVRYATPEYAGLQASYMHMAGGAIDDARRGSGDGVSVSYTHGGLNLRVIADQLADQYGRYTGADVYGLGSQGEWKFTKEVLVGGSYDLGKAKLFAGYNRVTAPDAGYATTAKWDNKAEQTWLGINYKLTEKLTVLGAAFHLKEDVSGKKSNLFAAGVNYDWNKYFSLYATVGSINNNTISADAASMNGANNHALYYWNMACQDSSNCNGSNSYGGYAGFVLKF
jgi:predicted porin